MDLTLIKCAVIHFIINQKAASQLQLEIYNLEL